MTAAGLSPESIEGILKIAATYKKKDDEPERDAATSLAIITKMIGETNEYIKGQSEADQKIYAVIIEKKKAELIEAAKKQ
ncbi:DAF-16/FOXO Controlled, germline Tumor affecting [Caenorhabditis elegans]|nr:DAF-16/FOXO Controlled, germline Tumor affecting [Caenorhabditis elegans]CBL43459.1 DAF-16/FOXO Controlled, germline Tumor affecting [Caenorhabditis elegans]|eukprot:NP_001256924.1 DAF-16/FOXO Controlled, germline Tumor affecting [Caenorhabditis elegans]